MNSSLSSSVTPPATALTKLLSAISECNSHLENIDYAIQQMEPLLPFDVKKYSNMQKEDTSHLDQFIFRFSKLQDSMGGRLFKSILDNIGELNKKEPLIDLLNKLEKFGIVQFRRIPAPTENGSEAHEWTYLREIRNQLVHEYPDDIGQRVAITNAALTCTVRLYEIYNSAKTYITEKVLSKVGNINLAAYEMPKLPTYRTLQELYLSDSLTTAPGD